MSFHFEGPAAPPVPNVTLDPRHPQTAVIRFNPPEGIADKLDVTAIQQVAAQGVGTPIMINRIVDLDGCPEVKLSGLAPDTLYVLNTIALSGDYQSDVVSTTFRTRKFLPLLFYVNK